MTQAISSTIEALKFNLDILCKKANEEIAGESSYFERMEIFNKYSKIILDISKIIKKWNAEARRARETA